MSTQTIIKLGNAELSPKTFCLIAGPCSIESRQQFLETATSVAKSRTTMLRGGMFKLRTNPDSYQGLGREAFDIAKSVKQEVNLPFVSEITDPRQIGDLMDVVDCFQVGSRNMHNYALLKELGQVDKPVLLKRGFSGLIDEWLLAADYVIKGGNEKVILCERGIRTFETATRNTFDLNAIAYIKKNHSIPVFADPSHATGDAQLVTPMSLAAIAAGADGIMVEVHPCPTEAKSDGYQALNLRQFDQLVEKIDKLLPIVGKTWALPRE